MVDNQRGVPQIGPRVARMAWIGPLVWALGAGCSPAYLEQNLPAGRLDGGGQRVDRGTSARREQGAEGLADSRRPGDLAARDGLDGAVRDQGLTTQDSGRRRDRGVIVTVDKGAPPPPADKGALAPVDKGALPPVDKGAPPPADKGAPPPPDQGAPPPADKGAPPPPADKGAPPPPDQGAPPPADKGAPPPADKGAPPPADKGTPPPPDQGAPPPADKGAPPPADEGAPPPPDQGAPPPPDQGGAPYKGPFPTGVVGVRSATLNVGSLNRTMLIYLPSGLTANAPLVFLFHGTDSNYNDIFSQTGARSLADSEKLVVIAPQARRMSSGDWDNHVGGQSYFETHPNLTPSNNGDLAMVQAVIAEARAAYRIDSRRVYTMGFSNGAFFSAFAAMRLPNQIAGFAEASGGLVRCTYTRSCNFTGSGTSCAVLASRAGWCSCSGTEKPAPVETGGRHPPGYLTHAADDNTVSPYFTCALESRMATVGYQFKTVIRSGGGHLPPSNLASLAYAYLRQFSLP